MNGPLHITFCEIDHYCNIYGIDRFSKKADFATFVKLLDNLWIEDYYEKEKKRKKAEETANKNKKK